MNAFFAEKILAVLEEAEGEFTASLIRDRVINRYGHSRFIENTTSVGSFLSRYCIRIGDKTWRKRD